jgi:hypothetical protein
MPMTNNFGDDWLLFSSSLNHSVSTRFWEDSLPIFSEDFS